jgi:hypothetical protein
MPETNEKAVEAVKLDASARDALASKINEQFNATMTLDVDEPVEEVEPEPTETVEETAEETTEETPKESSEATAEETPEETIEETPEETDDSEPAEAATKKAPTLPDSYRRSLKAYEWTDEEIDANLKSLGASFIQTAAKIHASRTKEATAWAELGRKSRQPAPSVTEGKSAKTASEVQDESPTLKPIDTEALKKQYGEDFSQIAAPVNEAIDRINRIMPEIRKSQKRQQEMELETLGRQIDNFFSGEDMKPYHKIYGTSSKALTEEQFTERHKVLEMADALIGGAKQQGRSIALNEALQLALDSTSGEVKEKVARESIKKTLKERSKGITLKPSSRAAPKPVGKTVSKEELEKRTAARMKKAFATA